MFSLLPSKHRETGACREMKRESLVILRLLECPFSAHFMLIGRHLSRECLKDWQRQTLHLPLYVCIARWQVTTWCADHADLTELLGRLAQKCPRLATGDIDKLAVIYMHVFLKIARFQQFILVIILRLHVQHSCQVSVNIHFEVSRFAPSWYIISLELLTLIAPFGQLLFFMINFNLTCVIAFN